MAELPFPSTELVDDFNRADTGPPPSASWTTHDGVGLLVAGNRVNPSTSGTDNASHYHVKAYGPSLDVTCKVDTKGANWMSLVLRLTNTAGGGFRAIEVAWLVSPNAIVVFDALNGTYTQVGPRYPVAWASGDSLGVRAMGSAIRPYIQAGAGAWNQVGYIWDTSHALEAGFVGMNLGSTDMFGDDLRAGTIRDDVERLDFTTFPKHKHREAVPRRDI